MGSALEGAAELDAKLVALEDKVRGRALSAAARAAIKPAFTLARMSVPVGTVAHKTYKGRLVAPGFAQRSIKVVAGHKDRGSRGFALLGVKREAFYATQFIELTRKGRTGTPWLEPSFESTKAEQLRILAQKLRELVLKAAGTSL